MLELTIEIRALVKRDGHLVGGKTWGVSEMASPLVEAHSRSLMGLYREVAAHLAGRLVPQEDIEAALVEGMFETHCLPACPACKRARGEEPTP